MAAAMPGSLYPLSLPPSSSRPAMAVERWRWQYDECTRLCQLFTVEENLGGVQQTNTKYSKSSQPVCQSVESWGCPHSAAASITSSVRGSVDAAVMSLSPLQPCLCYNAMSAC